MLRIGQLAAETGYTPKTLRYYEGVGLLSPSTRSESGYRLYDETVVERLRFVRRAQAAGIHLEDIRRILEISDEGITPCEHIVSVVDRELSRIAEQMDRLVHFRTSLLEVRSRIAESIDASDRRPGEVCPCFRDGARGTSG